MNFPIVKEQWAMRNFWRFEEGVTWHYSAVFEKFVRSCSTWDRAHNRKLPHLFSLICKPATPKETTVCDYSDAGSHCSSQLSALCLERGGQANANDLHVAFWILAVVGKLPQYSGFVYGHFHSHSHSDSSVPSAVMIHVILYFN